ncbi:hypothetical protein GG344DRAFT_69418 [Lentinula edodes]|nr:hypothetical protein GG344DRAFT_69418 [Lentinula edodes]
MRSGHKRNEYEVLSVEGYVVKGATATFKCPSREVEGLKGQVWDHLMEMHGGKADSSSWGTQGQQGNGFGLPPAKKRKVDPNEAPSALPSSSPTTSSSAVAIAAPLTPPTSSPVDLSDNGDRDVTVTSVVTPALTLATTPVVTLPVVIDTDWVFFDHPTTILIFQYLHKQMPAVARTFPYEQVMLKTVARDHQRLWRCSTVLLSNKKYEFKKPAHQVLDPNFDRKFTHLIAVVYLYFKLLTRKEVTPPSKGLTLDPYPILLPSCRSQCLTVTALPSLARNKRRTKNPGWRWKGEGLTLEDEGVEFEEVEECGAEENLGECPGLTNVTLSGYPYDPSNSQCPSSPHTDPIPSLSQRGSAKRSRKTDKARRKRWTAAKARDSAVGVKEHDIRIAQDSTPIELKAFDISSLPAGSNGWTASPPSKLNPGLRRIWMNLDLLSSSSLRLSDWDGVSCIVLLDYSDRIIAVLGSVPPGSEDEVWKEAAAQAEDAPLNYRVNGEGNQRAVAELLKNSAIRRIAGFQKTIFNCYARKTYVEYQTTNEELLRRHPHLRSNFAGGHLVLWDLGLVIRFPPGSTILFPSSLITHSTIPIQEGETRANGFQSDKDFLSTAGKENIIEREANGRGDLLRGDWKGIRRTRAGLDDLSELSSSDVEPLPSVKCVRHR